MSSMLDLLATGKQSSIEFISGVRLICISIFSLVRTAIPALGVPVAILSCVWFWVEKEYWSHDVEKGGRWEKM